MNWLYFKWLTSKISLVTSGKVNACEKFINISCCFSITYLFFKKGKAPSLYL